MHYKEATLKTIKSTFKRSKICKETTVNDHSFEENGPIS